FRLHPPKLIQSPIAHSIAASSPRSGPLAPSHLIASASRSVMAGLRSIHRIRLGPVRRYPVFRAPIAVVTEIALVALDPGNPCRHIGVAIAPELDRAPALAAMQFDHVSHGVAPGEGWRGL